jgi:two-component system, sensor histidine kinase and response regulator
VNCFGHPGKCSTPEPLSRSGVSLVRNTCFIPLYCKYIGHIKYGNLRAFLRWRVRRSIKRLTADSTFGNNLGAARTGAALLCVASLSVTTVGVLVIVGWFMRIPALTNLIPGFVFSAVAIVVATTAVLLCSRKRSHIGAERTEKPASQSDTNADFERREQEVERRFRFLSDRIPQIIWTSQPDGKLDYYNQRWFDYTGMTLEQTQGWGWEPVLHPDDLQNCIDRWTCSLTTGCDYEVEYRFRRASDGTYRWHLGRAFPLRDDRGEIVQWIGTCTDIEDQKRSREELAERVVERTAELSSAYAALEEKQQFLEVLVNNLEIGITASDSEGRVTLLNRTVREYNNLPAEGPVPNIPITERPARYGLYYAGGTELMRSEDMPMHRALCGESVRELEYVIMPPGGTRRLVVASGQPIVAPDGRKLGAVVAIHDVTERKQAEAELRAAKLAAESANRAKSEFLANMSHEIRTPMNGIIGMTGLLLDGDLDPPQREFAETIGASADALLAILNDILDFSKIEAGKLTFELLDFDLIETVESTLDQLAERAQTKGIELASAMASDLPRHLRGDPGRMRQILINLLGNALKFTTTGEVVVRVSKESETETHARVHFRVEDTGIGISPEAQGKLFRAFSQADGSTTRKFGGTGLGLAISKQLVVLMEGQIGVESEPAKGSTFWFTVQLEKQAGDATSSEASRRDLSDLRVLAVDDNATNRLILRHQLGAWQIQASSAASGQEALKRMRTAAEAGQPYHVALLDVQMPEMDGLTVARAIKVDATLAGTRLIVLTSFGQAFSPAELKAAGIEAYLVKPVKQSRLFDCLANALRKAAAENALLKLADPAPAALGSKPSLPLEKVERILLAEDNRINQQVALGHLAKLGYRANAVGNGWEVLEALKLVPYDVIIMDCQMPEMDGYEATQAIRQQEQSLEHSCPWNSPIYIIALTAHAMQGDREKCLAAGMDDYLSKPVRAAELQAALERGRQTSQNPFDRTTSF